jgi:hypothetical protein
MATMEPPRRPAACRGNDRPAPRASPASPHLERTDAPGEQRGAPVTLPDGGAARPGETAPAEEVGVGRGKCHAGWTDGFTWAGWRLGRLVSLELTLGPDINGLDEELQRQVLLPNCREISFHPTGGPTATREDRRRRTGGGLSDTSYGTDRARRCRFQVCSLAFQPFLRAQTVPYFLTQTAVYLTALGSQNFSPTWSATSFVIGPVVTGESGFVMNPVCLISWFGPNPAGENGDD